MGNLDSMLDELNNMENSITLRDENGEEVKLYVLFVERYIKAGGCRSSLRICGR